MKIEKTIETANITDYIESVEILDGGKLKVIFDIPDDLLAGCVFYNEEQKKALQLVYEEEPILTLDYLMFSRGKFSWGRNYIKIGDHWFGTF